jgi:hypothetical protein
MLHAGLDLSRKKLDVCLLSGSGEHVDQLAVPPDGEALRALARRIDEVYREPVCAVIESMTGARLVHDTLEQEGWDVEIADAQRVKGLAPLACRPTRRRAGAGRLKPARPGAGDLAARPPDPARARAGPLSPAPGQAQVDGVVAADRQRFHLGPLAPERVPLEIQSKSLGITQVLSALGSSRDPERGLELPTFISIDLVDVCLDALTVRRVQVGY